MWFHSLFGSPNLQRSSKASHKRLRKRSGYSNNTARLAVESLERRNLMAAAVLSIGDATIVEGNSGTRFAEVMVTLSGGRNNSVTVNYSTANSSALAGSDYTAKSGKLTFAKNETSKIIQVEVSGDRTVEPDEYFRVLLTNAKGAKLGDREGIVTITDNEPRIFITSPDDFANEGDSDPNTLEFTVELTAAYDQEVTVNFATSDGTAEAGSDYTAKSGTVKFDVGQTSQTISVLVNDDRIVEPLDEYSFHEYFTVTLSAPSSNAVINQDTGYGYIIDDEPRISISSPDAVYEAGSGTTTLEFTVELSAAYDQEVTVHFATSDVTAEADGDYTAKSETVTFAPNVTSQKITVLVNDDQLVESTYEYFAVTLSAPSSNAAISQDTAYGYIIDDEPHIVIEDAYYYDDGYSAPSITFTVTLSTALEGEVTVDYATFDDNSLDYLTPAIAGIDYTAASGTLTFSPGTTTATFTIEVLNPNAYYQYFAVQFSNATGEAGLVSSVAYGYLNYYYWYYDPGYGYGDGYGYYYY